MSKIYTIPLVALASLTCGFLGSKLESSLRNKESSFEMSTAPYKAKTVSGNFEADNSMLSKIGFYYYDAKAQIIQIPGTPIGSDRRSDFIYTGTTYTFQVEEQNHKPRQILVIRGYQNANGLDPQSEVQIIDCDHDNEPEVIFFMDKDKNIEYRIDKNSKNELTSNRKIPPQVMIDQFQYFTAFYKKFKKEQAIDDQIRDFKPIFSLKFEEKPYSVQRNWFKQ